MDRKIHHQDLFLSPNRDDCKCKNITTTNQGTTKVRACNGVQYWEKDRYKTVIVVPSLSFDPNEIKKIMGAAHYEERGLFNLILLRNPGTRVLFLTSEPLDPSIVEYYWRLLPEDMTSSVPNLKDRLTLMSTYDSTPIPLTQKLLQRPRMLRRIKSFIQHPDRTCITCFNPTKLEHQLAEELGVPLVGPPLSTLYCGTKDGSRKAFKEAGVLHAPGTPLVFSEQELAEQITDLILEHPHVRKVVVKLNDSFSGCGNALLVLHPHVDKHIERNCRKFCDDKCITSNEDRNILIEKIKEQFSGMRFQGDGEHWDSYKQQIPILGVLAEEFIYGATGTESSFAESPSCQACIDINGNVCILSTHEQILGGADGQMYLGCKFPCDGQYRLHLQQATMKIGKVLAEKGCIGHFAVDFLAVPDKDKGEFEVYALEINLRQGGTTHPMMTLKLLTDGLYDIDNGLFRSKDGTAKFYVATDNLKDPKYKGLLPQDIIEIFGNNSLHFSHDTETGVVFHMLGCLSQFGKLGVTCIANSATEAEKLYDATVQLLKQEIKETGTEPICGITK